MEGVPVTLIDYVAAVVLGLLFAALTLAFI